MFGLLLFILLAAIQISAEGYLATAIGLAGALGVDIVAALITGAGLGSVLTGAGMADDMVMIFLNIGMGVSDKILLSVFIEQAMHAGEEAYEHYSHTDYQNRRYAAYLARKTPGVTYVYGDVTHKDLYELGFSGGLLLYRGKLPELFEALTGKLEGFWSGALEETSDALAAGALF